MKVSLASLLYIFYRILELCLCCRNFFFIKIKVEKGQPNRDIKHCDLETFHYSIQAGKRSTKAHGKGMHWDMEISHECIYWYRACKGKPTNTGKPPSLCSTFVQSFCVQMLQGIQAQCNNYDIIEPCHQFFVFYFF